MFSKCGLIAIPGGGGGPYLSMGKREKTPYFRDIFTFCVPVGCLVLLQGPYFLCFVQIHARSVNSVYSYENLSVCDYSNLFIFAKKKYKLHFWVPIWLPRVFFWTLFSKKNCPYCTAPTWVPIWKLCRNYVLSGCNFWSKFDGRGHKNILKDRAPLGPHFLFWALGKA